MKLPIGAVLSLFTDCGLTLNSSLAKISEMSAALFESCLMNHPFWDGNKRVAFFGTDVFLRINGYFLDVNDDQAYQFLMKKFDTKACDYDNLLTWIRESIKRR